jgi:hypothetical protein
MALAGKGFFIWKIPNCEAGNATAIASAAAAAGLSHVLIKIADGNYASNYSYSTKTDLVPPVVQALHKKGIQVWGWHYVYGGDPVGEAKIAISRCQSLSLDGYAIDAEGEYKTAGRATAASRFMTELRRAMPNFPIALCSYRYPTYHPQLPWKAFLEKCDYNMPQVYWEQAHNPGAQLRRCVKEFQAIAPFRPIMPVGAAYSTSGWTPTVSDLNEFLATVKDLGLPAASFFSWDYARNNLKTLWGAVGAYSWPVDSVPSPTVAQLLFQALNSHDPTTIANLYTTNAIRITSAATLQGVDSVKAWYDNFFTKILTNATFKMTGVSSVGNTRHLTWTATGTNGKITDGKDTFGIVGGKIGYHYSYFTVSPN